MNIICAILTGLHFLVQRVRTWGKKPKISKKNRREKAIFLAGTTAVAAVAFSFHGVHAQGRNQGYEMETGPEQEGQEEEPESGGSLYGLDSILQDVLLSQDTEIKVARLGTSLEVILVGQRMSERELVSRLDFQSQGVENVERLRDKSLEISEGRLLMSDEDYETLLKIVEAEAGGEDARGKILVANVICNRVKDEKFPSTISEVVWQNEGGTAQFSPTADGRIYTVTVSEDTREAVNRAIDGEDYSEGALFFVEEAYADQDNVNWFKEDLKFLFKHGVHDFYTYP